MANAVAFDYYPKLAGTIELPANRGVFRNTGLILFQRQSLPTDPIGTHTLTLTNVVVGSRYRIERQSDGSLVLPEINAEGTAASSTIIITLDVFSQGNPSNDIRIKVRKGTSAPKYLPFETLTTISTTPQSIYISQIPDTIA